MIFGLLHIIQVNGVKEYHCRWETISYQMWPSHYRCNVNLESDDLMLKDKDGESAFIGNSNDKNRATAVGFYFTHQVEFVPNEIFQAFPNLEGLVIWSCKIPVLKEGLFTSEFKSLQYLYLGSNEIENIEKDTFVELVNLKWIALYGNRIEFLNHQLFANNPKLERINFSNNKIIAITPNFFDPLKKLIEIDLEGNECIDKFLETAKSSWSFLKLKYHTCFDNCLKDSICSSANLKNSEPQLCHQKEDLIAKLTKENFKLSLSNMKLELEKKELAEKFHDENEKSNQDEKIDILVRKVESLASDLEEIKSLLQGYTKA
jgi:hypothetical protein